MGVNLKNGAGENCLHVMFRLDRRSCQASSSENGYRSYPAFQIWMREKILEGKTPLHILCQKEDWKKLFLIGKKLKKFHPDKYQGMNCMNWFDQRDSNDFTALDKMRLHGPEELA